ncbi:LacI family DNA-binding transcriptional regulator [Saccharibacillus alkalitolerans]|uniref:LacI family transcriptional regulator n=1 Tax=Saccharibacillus alkalitolerans TaxID=2705290 RepID=A0ABX0F3M7_9BACL|nr:LacI family DNA-binding transcriptional regulator [Saccharibacillus alkalitolerans]NGZ73796.1 LacI family transcriptional regulator [Saccharibacillus alkalitolerans]
MRPVTVYDIAREANVSVATVSRVLNNTAPVKKETRDRIVALMNKHQFQPNALARSLTRKETGMIGFILPDITNPFFPEVLSGFDSEARRLGYTYFLCDTISTNEENQRLYDRQYERESQYLGLLMEKQVDGIVMIGGRVDLAKPDPELAREVEELAKRVPIVLLNGSLPKTKLNRVSADQKLGAQLAVQHLIGLGHRDIALIGGYAKMSNTQQRLSGFRSAMKDAGLAVRREWTLTEGFSVEKGQEFAARLLNMKRRPTAMFCLNDLLAIGALKAAHRAGIAVPEELSIVGYDDIPQATYSIPELTTVSLKSQEIGRQAAKTLDKMIAGKKVPALQSIVPELIVRETTAPPPDVPGA